MIGLCILRLHERLANQATLRADLENRVLFVEAAASNGALHGKLALWRREHVCRLHKEGSDLVSLVG